MNEIIAYSNKPWLQYNSTVVRVQSVPPMHDVPPTISSSVNPIQLVLQCIKI